MAYNQCVTRVAQTDDRLEQFRSTIRRDALDMALTVQRAGQDMQHQQQAIEHIKSTLFEDVQDWKRPKGTLPKGTGGNVKF